MKLLATIAIATILPFALASNAEARDSKHSSHKHSSKSKSSRGHGHSHSHHDSRYYGSSRSVPFNFSPRYGYHQHCQPGMVQIMVPGLGFVFVRPSDVGHFQVCR